MLFSAHVANTNPLAALRRRTPQPAEAPGLRSARTATCAPFTRGVLPRPQLGREALLACWEDAGALDRFLADHPTGRVFADGWHVRMELIRAAGVWPGLADDMVDAAGAKAKTVTGPSVAITIGTAYLKTIVPFVRVNSGLEDQFLDTPSGIWGTAMTNLPQRLVATLTVWESPDAALDYIRTGAHGSAVAAHYDPAKDPTGHTFVTGGGFFGFRPLSVHGAVGGTNPVSADLLAGWV
jgi:hypothetical protein